MRRPRDRHRLLYRSPGPHSLGRHLLGRRFLAVALLIGVGGALLGQQAYLGVKARLAQFLIERAYARHLAEGTVERPWAWADTYPIAKLSVPGLGEEHLILAGSSGTSMAFGVGHMDGTALPNTCGNCVITGHRDGVFAFLGELHPGDDIYLSTRNAIRRYQVIDRLTVEERERWILEPSDDRLLTLVTCFPLNGLAPSSQRLVIVARQRPED